MNDSKRNTRLSPEVSLPQPSLERQQFHDVAKQFHAITKTLEPWVRGMCSRPEQLVIREQIICDGRVLTIFIAPHQADMGIVCGKGGRQINALRFLIQELGKRSGVETDVKLEQRNIGEREPRKEFVENPNFNEVTFERSFRGLLSSLFGTIPTLTILYRNGKLKVYIRVRDEHPKDIQIVQALADIIYVWGYAHGKKIEIRQSTPGHDDDPRNSNR